MRRDTWVPPYGLMRYTTRRTRHPRRPVSAAAPRCHCEERSDAAIRFSLRKDGFPRQCVPQGHLLRGAHWLGMTERERRDTWVPPYGLVRYTTRRTRHPRRPVSHASRPRRRGGRLCPSICIKRCRHVGRGPRAPPGSTRIVRRDTWVPPYGYARYTARRMRRTRRPAYFSPIIPHRISAALTISSPQ